MKSGYRWQEAKRGAYLCAVVCGVMFSLPCACGGGKGALAAVIGGPIGFVLGLLLGGIVGFLGARQEPDDKPTEGQPLP
jgi:hypothetical protein